jgi:hypothetical protein
LQCREETEQAHEGKARVPEEALDEAAAEAGWEAKVSVWEENAYALIVATGQLTNEARPVTR